MKKLLGLLIFAAAMLMPTTASAQCNGIFPNNTVCGNTSGGSNVPSPITLISNVINVQTVNYTVATTDCNSTVQSGTGTTGFITVTLPAAGGFPSPCVIRVLNGDSARGKKLTGFPSAVGGILYPGQDLVVEQIGGSWVSVQQPKRWRLSTNTGIYFDDANGNDTNDGLAPGAGNALKHLQNAWDNAASNFDLNGFVLTVQGAAGQTTNDNVLNTSRSMLGAKDIFSVVIDGGGSTYNQTLGENWLNIGANVGTAGVMFSLQNFKCTASSGGCIYDVSAQIAIVTGAEFGAVTLDHVQVWNPNAQVQFTNVGYTISGGAQVHWSANTGGVIVTNNITITCTGSPNFSISFVTASFGPSQILTNGAAFSGCGTATGRRYAVGDNAMIDITPAASATALTYFPGSIAGIVFGGGVFVANGAAVDSAIKSAFSGNSGVAGTTCATNSTCFFWMGQSAAAEASVEGLVPFSGVLRNLYVQAGTATPGGVQTFTLTVRVANADTALTCQMVGAAPTCQDIVHTVNISAGQVISIKAVTSATANASAFLFGLELDPQ